MPRPPQQRMAEPRRTILAQDELIAEAGTGTGKTYAYLVPALLRAAHHHFHWHRALQD